jgi:hypothetical protein
MKRRFSFLSPSFLRLPGIISFNHSQSLMPIYPYSIFSRQPDSQAITGLLPICAPQWFCHGFCPSLRATAATPKQNIRTNANPGSKVPGSKAFTDVRGSITTLPFHSASGFTSLRPGYISFQLRLFHALPHYIMVMQHVFSVFR